MEISSDINVLYQLNVFYFSLMYNSGNQTNSEGSLLQTQITDLANGLRSDCF